MGTVKGTFTAAIGDEYVLVTFTFWFFDYVLQSVNIIERNKRMSRTRTGSNQVGRSL